MLQISIKDQEPVAKVNLSGTIDESANLEPILQIKTSAVEIQCNGVIRINSIGIEHWRTIFSEFRSYGRKLTFIEVSPVLVEVQNFIASFVEISEEISLCIPYDCLSCKTNFLKTIKTDSVLSQLAQLRSSPCEKCGKPAEMTEVPEEYFSFIIKASRHQKNP